MIVADVRTCVTHRMRDALLASGYRLTDDTHGMGYVRVWGMRTGIAFEVSAVAREISN